MFTDWTFYQKPLHLNNISGTGMAGGDFSSGTTTPFVVLSESDGDTYTPKTTNYMDVYSGGSPFTFTQELVQRGAEVQEDTIRIAIIGTTPEDCVDKLQILRTSLTNQHLFGPQVLSIKREGQSSYTEWLIHSAIIQEENTYLGRDIKNNGYPVVFVSIVITRSPYGSDSEQYISYLTKNGSNNFALAYDLNYVLQYTTKFYGSYLNFTLDVNYQNMLGRPPSTFGPIALFSLVDDWITDVTPNFTGTLSAGATISYSNFIHPIYDTSNSDYPLQICVVTSATNNDVEMRISYGGYYTPYIRSVGTQINATNGTQRLFVLPPLNVKEIFSGASDYNIHYSLNIGIHLRNINRGGSTSFTIHKVLMYRTDNVLQIFPTTDWSSRTIGLANIKLYSFYDQISYPSQPLPKIKAHLTTYTSYVGPLDGIYYTQQVFSESLEVRGSSMIVKRPSGRLSISAILMEYNGTCPLGSTGLTNILVKYAPQYLAIKD